MVRPKHPACYKKAPTILHVWYSPIFLHRNDFLIMLCQIKTSTFSQILWQSCLHLWINLIISEMSFYQELNVTICYWTGKVLYIERKVVIFWKAILLETPTKAQRVWGKGTFFSSFGCLEGRKNGNGTKSVASHYQTNRMPTQ